MTELNFIHLIRNLFTSSNLENLFLIILFDIYDGIRCIRKVISKTKTKRLNANLK